MEDCRYVIADEIGSFWGHLFGPGSHETTTRFVFDRETDAIVAAEHLSGSAWLPMDEAMLANFHDHLVNANRDALDEPGRWGLRVDRHVPEWAVGTQASLGDETAAAGPTP